MALGAITVNRLVGNGKYSDVIDIAEVLASEDLGTPANAIAVMVRESDRFRKANCSGALKRRKKNRRLGRTV